MKKVSIGVAIVVSALVVGCQDSRNNNPISGDFSKNTPSLSKQVKSTPGGGTIDLRGRVTVGETESLENSYDVVGTVQYTLFNTGDQSYQLSFVSDGSVQSLGSSGSLGKFYSESFDQVIIPTKDPVSYEKVYGVGQLDRTLELHVVFNVTQDAVQVSNFWLSPPSWFDKAAK